MCDDDSNADAPVPVDDRRTDSQQFWRCPHCGQIVFGELSPFVCENCRDAVTWEPWEPGARRHPPAR
jgi:hypothetical protein